MRFVFLAHRICWVGNGSGCMHTCMWSLVAALGCSGFKIVLFCTSEIGGWTGMHCALQKKRDTAFCTSHCSPACRPYKSAVLMWCLCLSSTSWCALVQEHQRWDYTVGKGEASGFSAPSSLALPPASPNSSSFPDHRTQTQPVWRVSFSVTLMKLDFCDFSFQHFHIWSPFYHLWTDF